MEIIRKAPQKQAKRSVEDGKSISAQVADVVVVVVLAEELLCG